MTTRTLFVSAYFPFFRCLSSAVFLFPFDATKSRISFFRDRTEYIRLRKVDLCSSNAIVVYSA